MTAFGYAGIAARAEVLFERFGQTVTVSRYSPTVDGVTGSVTKGVATDSSTTKAIVLPASKGTIEAFDNRLENGSLAGKELRYVKMPASSITFVPRAFDEVTLESATWRVLGCTPVNPAGTPLVYGMGLVKL